MLRIRLDINGTLIGTIGVWNTEETNDDGELRYQIHDIRGFEGNHISDAPLITDVWHDQTAGAAELTARVMVLVPEEHIVDLRS